MGQVCANATAHVTGLGSPVPFWRVQNDVRRTGMESELSASLTYDRKPQTGGSSRSSSFGPYWHTRRPPLPFQPLRRFESSLHKPFSTVSGMKPMSRVEALTRMGHRSYWNVRGTQLPFQNKLAQKADCRLKRKRDASSFDRLFPIGATRIPRIGGVHGAQIRRSD